MRSRLINIQRLERVGDKQARSRSGADTLIRDSVDKATT
jgi:hypothetical protein